MPPPKRSRESNQMGKFVQRRFRTLPRDFSQPARMAFSRSTQVLPYRRRRFPTCKSRVLPADFCRKSSLTAQFHGEAKAIRENLILDLRVVYSWETGLSPISNRRFRVSIVGLDETKNRKQPDSYEKSISPVFSLARAGTVAFLVGSRLADPSTKRASNQRGRWTCAGHSGGMDSAAPQFDRPAINLSLTKP